MADGLNTATESNERYRSIIDLTSEQLGRRVIIVSGDVDIANAPNLHEQLIEAFRDSIDEVVVDLRAVSFIDSTGLGVLVNARQRARTTGSRLKLILPDGQARFPFEVTGLASLFEKHDPNQDDAVVDEVVTVN